MNRDIKVDFLRRRKRKLRTEFIVKGTLLTDHKRSSLTLREEILTIVGFVCVKRRIKWNVPLPDEHSK